MAKIELKFGAISTDDHVQEAPDTWTARMPKAQWGDRIPRIFELEDGTETWLMNGEPLGGLAVVASLMPDRRTPPKRWEEVPRAAYAPAERLAAMDADHTDVHGVQRRNDRGQYPPGLYPSRRPVIAAKAMHPGGAFDWLFECRVAEVQPAGFVTDVLRVVCWDAEDDYGRGAPRRRGWRLRFGELARVGARRALVTDRTARSHAGVQERLWRGHAARRWSLAPSVSTSTGRTSGTCGVKTDGSVACWKAGTSVDSRAITANGGVLLPIR